MALLVFAICAVLFPLMARAYQRGAPGKAQNALEVFVDFLRGVVKENVTHHGEKYLPIVGGFFFFIFIANAFGWFFFLQPPTSNLNTTFALSISCFLFFNAAGIKEHGLFGYLKHFLGPMLALAPLLFVIEMIGNFARALSLAMRLFGNIFGEHMANSIFSGLVPLVVPWPIQALGLLAAFLQAYVFALLCSVYIGAQPPTSRTEPNFHLERSLRNDQEARNHGGARGRRSPRPRRRPRRGSRQGSRRRRNLVGPRVGRLRHRPRAAFGALAQGRAAAAACDGIARNPGATGQIRGMAFLALVLIESLVIYALVIAFVVQGK